MKPTFIKSILLLLLNVTIVSKVAIAQYEQKLTFQAAGGFVHTISPDFFRQVFENGFSLDAGAQYNFSRSTSLVVLGKYSKFFASDNFLLQSADYNLIGISLCPKLRFFSSSKINPYILGGASINYYSYSYSFGGNEQTTPWATKFGFIGGAGIDLRINDNFAIFCQAGINGVGLSDEFLIALFTQVGINISFLKSKSL
jgi:opacity protein-like surface antigen